jgi:hypothetical protein
MYSKSYIEYTAQKTAITQSLKEVADVLYGTQLLC